MYINTKLKLLFSTIEHCKEDKVAQYDALLIPKPHLYLTITIVITLTSVIVVKQASVSKLIPIVQLKLGQRHQITKQQPFTTVRPSGLL